MLEEQSGQLQPDFDVPDPADSMNPRIFNIRHAVSQVMDIQQTNKPPGDAALVQFAGTTLVESNDVLDLLEPTLKKAGVHAYYSQGNEPDLQLITVLEGRFNPSPRPWWPNLLLFISTVLSLLWVGSLIAASGDGREISSLSDIRLWEGWQYASGLMLILGAHELGHYFAARYHNVDVTLPYFIPLPFGFFGTLGAFIQLREPMRNRNMLFDVGVAGPLAGLIFAVPILLYGLATADIEVIPQGEGFIREGNSIAYALAKIVAFGRFVPDGNEDVLLNQFAQAGWTGLFVTALNLIPVGQLDGGHVLFTLVGRYARRMFIPIVSLFVFLTLFVNTSWALWTILLFFFGRMHAVPLNSVTPLSSGRRILGIITLIIFVLIFIPNPIEIVNP